MMRSAPRNHFFSSVKGEDPACFDEAPVLQGDRSVSRVTTTTLGDAFSTITTVGDGSGGQKPEEDIEIFASATPPGDEDVSTPTTDTKKSHSWTVTSANPEAPLQVTFRHLPPVSLASFTRKSKYLKYLFFQKGTRRKSKEKFIVNFDEKRKTFFFHSFFFLLPRSSSSSRRELRKTRVGVRVAGIRGAGWLKISCGASELRAANSTNVSPTASGTSTTIYDICPKVSLSCLSDKKPKDDEIDDKDKRFFFFHFSLFVFSISKKNNNMLFSSQRRTCSRRPMVLWTASATRRGRRCWRRKKVGCELSTSENRKKNQSAEWSRCSTCSPEPPR